MAMMRKVSNPIATLVLLALAASTAVRLHSRLAAGLPSEWEHSSSESLRKLKHVPAYYYDSNSFYDQTHRDLEGEGNEPKPNDQLFETILRNRFSKQEYVLLQDFEQFRQSESDLNKTLLGLVEEGVAGLMEQKEPRSDKVRHKDTANDAAQEDIVNDQGQDAVKAKIPLKLNDSEQSQENGEAQMQLEMLKEEDYQPLAICDRNADVGSAEDFAAMQEYAQCTDITKDKPILLLEGIKSHGRTGNNIIEFLHAIQEARDMDIQLGIMYRSWAMKLLLTMWMAIDSDDWQTQFERTFCVKIFNREKELEGWDVVHQDTKELFYYRSELPLQEYVASQEQSLRTLFRHYNTGEGHDFNMEPVQDMCSGINAIFGKDERSSAMYSVIHSRTKSRTLAGDPGFTLLGTVARKSGCDPAAALEMRPDYIKAILDPLGMLQYPIVVITDDRHSAVLARLLADPDIGHLIRTVPEEACWIGGDLTLAIMSNAFIGNPASSFSGFIAKSRLALGFGHNYLFRARDKNTGEWSTVCGDQCIFDKTVMNVMS